MLPEGQPPPPFPEDRLVPFWKPTNHGVGSQADGRTCDLRLGHIRIEKGEILQDRTFEKARALIDDTDVTAQGTNIPVHDIMTTHEHSPAVEVVRAVEQSSERGLPPPPSGRR